MIVQVIKNQVVINTVIVPDSATLSASQAKWPSSKSVKADVWKAPEGAKLMAQGDAQIGWILNSDGVLVPPTRPPAPFVDLQAALVSAAKAAAQAIITAIEPDPTHARALSNATAIVAGTGGLAPNSSSPFYAAFNANAADYSVSPTQFAAMLTAGLVQSQALSVALNELEADVAVATTAPALATALAAFEAALATVVAGLNAAFPAPIAAPPAILIAGINA